MDGLLENKAEKGIGVNKIGFLIGAVIVLAVTFDEFQRRRVESAAS